MPDYKTLSRPVRLFLTLINCLCLIVYPYTANSSEATATEFNLTEVASGVYVHQGQHLSIEHENNGDIANIGFIVGEDCIAVIDTGGSVEIGLQLRKAVSKVSSLPVCYVINTHIHFDHILGNLAFKSNKTKYVGHQNLIDEIPANQAFFLQSFTSNLGEAGAAAVIGPDITVKDSLELDLGNRTLLLVARSVAHSHTDLTVYDKNTNTLWLSDLLFKERIPALDGSLKGWINLMKDLQSQDIKQVIPGHGPVVLSWPTGAVDQERYLDTLLQQTRKAIAEGQFMEEIVENVANEEKQNWLLHEENHKRNVTRAFTELEWE